MSISRRKHYMRSALFLIIMVGVLAIGSPIANYYSLKLEIVNRVCLLLMLADTVIILAILIVLSTKYKNISTFISRYRLLTHIEKNLISVGAYETVDEKNYLKLPKIRITDDTITIRLPSLRIRTIVERHLAAFSTALPEDYLVEDYLVSESGSNAIIQYEDRRNYQPEQYMIPEYIEKIKSLDDHTLYLDRKHTLDLNEYPHLLISGSSGSGKSYLALQLITQAILKGYIVTILDVKRSYGIFREYSAYEYEPVRIVRKLESIEEEMKIRMENLEVALNHNPGALASDIGYPPMLVVIEEFISLQSSLEKKDREALERVVKNLAVLARQSCIHLVIVMQSAGTENINSTTRSNLTKILLGSAQSNIQNATFGTGVDIPHCGRLGKGEGLIQLDRISVIRVPIVSNIEGFNIVCGEVPKADLDA